MILKCLNDFDTVKRSDIEDLLLDKLPDVLSEQQKKNKVRNLLQSLRQENKIIAEGKTWKLADE